MRARLFWLVVGLAAVHPDAVSRAAEPLDRSVAASRPKRLAGVGAYASTPNDPYFPNQWHLENRATIGPPVSTGADVNARAAWPVTRGEGVVIAFGDTGVLYTHPDLAGNNAGAFNLDFSTVSNGDYSTGSTNALPTDANDAHATAVAGLAAAVGNNGTGVSGVAPGAQFASWKVFTSGNFNINSQQEMMMYEYQSNRVAVQSYSWGDALRLENPLNDMEDQGIQAAVTQGRGGRGVVIVRAAGDDRATGFGAVADGNDANDDPYANDPREIAVGAVGLDGRVASYSSPGACVLVAAPGGDISGSILNFGWPWQTNPPNLTTTAWTANGSADPNDPGYYTFSSSLQGFRGTSASTPVVAGIAALVLSANTNLTARDVQQVLALSSRHYDLADPGLQTNGAGLRVSYNVGYGVPDAGLAVRLAKIWTNRPPAISVTNTVNLLSAPKAIPQDGLRLVVSNAPAALASIQGTPSYGAQADQPTPFAVLTNLGAVTGPVATNLSGKGALIERSAALDFYQQINYAAWAGAAFAVIYDNQNEARVTMPKTDFAAIPAMLIAQTNGAALAAWLQTNAAQPVRGQMTALTANVSFNITPTLSCEHVHLLVYTDCPNRSGMRIVLTSPAGTRSVMQHLNQDTSAGPYEWTYRSVEHFFEGSFGTWQAAFSYEQPGTSGNILYVSLAIDGVSIVDADHDGLDDRWETAWFGNLSHGPKESAAGDGWPNSVRQILGGNPKNPLFPFNVDLSLWNSQWARLAWPGVEGGLDEIFSLGGSPPIAVPGRFSQSEYFIDFTGPMGFYYIRRP